MSEQTKIKHPPDYQHVDVFNALGQRSIIDSGPTYKVVAMPPSKVESILGSTNPGVCEDIKDHTLTILPFRP